MGTAKKRKVRHQGEKAARDKSSPGGAKKVDGIRKVQGGRENPEKDKTEIKDLEHV